jgi:hypothetical protein
MKLKFQSLDVGATLALKPPGLDYQDAFGKVINEVPDLVNPTVNQ